MNARDIYDRALEFIFPPRCMICTDIIPLDKPRWICKECDGLLEFIAEACKRCGAPSERGLCAECADINTRDFLDGNRALFIYDDAAKRLVYNFKYSRHPEIARGLAGIVTQNNIKELFYSADYIAYVPLHRNRVLKRGYNQAELLARELSKTTGAPLVNALYRKKDTKPQSGLDYISRMNNLKDAFAANEKCEIKNKKIIIVDDIYTTGATLNSCAEVLKEQNAANVFGFTVAVAMKK